jgi:outer membrane lipoprotein SlyB
MYTIQILNYNNYFNRIVKRGSRLEDYQDFVLYTLERTNFVPNDGVMTEHVIGSGDYDGQGDYFVVIKDNEIVSRWFIIESVRTRSGQYKLTLRRDLIVDYYNKLVDSPIFIEKATPNSNSPFIFNKENMSYNQIKKGEWLLQDETKCPWIVGYIARNKVDSANNLSGAFVLRDDESVNDSFISYPSVETFPIYEKYKSGGDGKFFVNPGNLDFKLVFRFNITFDKGLADGVYQIEVSANPNVTLVPLVKIAGKDKISSTGNTVHISDYDPYNDNEEVALMWFRTDLRSAILNIRPQLSEATFSSTGNFFDQTTDIWANTSQYTQLYLYEDTPLLFGDGKVWSYEVNNTGTVSRTVKLNPASGVAVDKLTPAIRNIVSSSSNYTYEIKTSPDQDSYGISSSCRTFQTLFTQRKELETTYDISNGRRCEDEVFDLFAIPYGAVKVTTLNGVVNVDNKDVALDLARTIQRNGGDAIYDVQILPYCPCRDLILSDGSINATSAQSSISVGNDMFVFFPIKSNFTVENIEIVNSDTSSFNWDDVSKIGDSIETKIISECDELRLSSPNYNGQFSFNIAKNYGSVYFSADCSYKPFTPYIHVNPNFGGLYGKDFNDARGLICQGDFSISSVTDAWVQYEINNKNYNNIFNREIQSMELNNSIAKTKDIFGAIIGIVQGGISGASTGAQMGGGFGAMAGAVIGAGAGAIGGAMDIYYNEILRKEGVDLKKDLYGYQLGNIQALPYSLSKVTALNSNNKLFPFIEYYTCTDEEKEALKNKLKYNGYTIMAIGTIREYLENAEEQYFKGRLIRFEDNNEDYHVVNAIKEELEKGVFLRWDSRQIY